jgi:hypothetical protein
MFRRLNALLTLVGATAAIAAFAAAPAFAGPVVLAGIDTEDCGAGTLEHGPTQSWGSVTSAIYNGATNGGTGILVIGGGKSASDGPTLFWQAISTFTGFPVSFINGPGGILAQSFAGFRMLAVVSDDINTCSGLTAAENDALTTRSGDIATFVDAGGGLLGSSSEFAGSASYGYTAGINGGTPVGAFHALNADVDALPAGYNAGFDSSTLDICCWHQKYLTYSTAFTDLLFEPLGPTTDPGAIGQGF